MVTQSVISRLSAFLLILPFFLSVPQATAARFILPDDAIVDIREFPFPSSTDDKNKDALTEAFHIQLTLALEQAGLVIFHDKATPEFLAATPPQAPANPNDKSDDASTEDNSEDSTEEFLMIQEPRPPYATHVLEGTVTLFRENVGHPTRIGENIRIRAESQVHCTYKIKDAVTGKVLLSDVSSGSAAKIASETEDIDATLHMLNARAMTATAITIGANLSGNALPKNAADSSRSYYQDSPGKRLKVKWP